MFEHLNKLEEKELLQLVIPYLLQKSKGKVDKYGNPIAMRWNEIEQELSSKLHTVETREKLRLILLKKNINPEGIEQVLDAIIKQLPKILNIFGETIGKEFQTQIRDIDDLIDKAILKSDVQYHYNTLEECSVDYLKKKQAGEYSSKRQAWRDAVDRGITYTDKKGKKVKLKNFMQLERALERIRDCNRQDEFGLEE